MSKDIEVGQRVIVGPNLRSLFSKDHQEEPWPGRIERIHNNGGIMSVDVTPENGDLPRNVLPDQVKLSPK